MAIRRTTTVLLLAALATLTPHAAAQMTKDEAMALAERYKGGMGAVQTEPPEPVELSDADLSGLIAAVTQLHELGMSLDLEGAKTDAGRAARAFEANERAYGILKSNGFSLERFQQVLYSVAMAIAVVDGDIDGDEMDEAAKAMEQMKGRLTPEQLAAMRSAMGTAGAQLDRLRDQPPGNLELVRKRRAELERAFERGGS